MTETSLTFVVTDTAGGKYNFSVSDIKLDADPDDLFALGTAVAEAVPGNVSSMKKVDKITTEIDLD